MGIWILKKNIEKFEKSIRLKATESFLFPPNIYPISQNHVDNIYLVCRRIDPKPSSKRSYATFLYILLFVPRLLSYFAAYDSISPKRKRPDLIFELYAL